MTSFPPASPPASDLFTPRVQFADEGRAEGVTRVQLAEFDGPLGLLLALIEARQLDVLTVPLSALAGAYLEALATLQADRLGNVSSFVAVASQLILIKSRAILPRQPAQAPTALPDEGPDPEAELRSRLILYRAFRDAGARLQDEAAGRGVLFHRDPSAAAASAASGARAPVGPPLDPRRLVSALDELIRIVELPPPPAEIIPRTITIAERATLIREALRGADSIVLQDLLLGVRDRVVVAITFLAMLELMKRREIVVEQTEPWGPIVARQARSDERGAAGAAAVDDTNQPAEPIDESLESFA